MHDVTTILGAIQAGDPQAANALLPAVYAELRRLAEQRVASLRAGDSLQATALVHEAYLRLVGGSESAATAKNWSGRAHFFSAAATAMRRILIDRARARGAQKRGGRRLRLQLNEADAIVDSAPEDLLSLHEALEQLAQEDPAKSQLVELRFFAGLTLAEAADVLGISKPTAERYWAYARAWLYDALNADAPSPSKPDVA